MANDLQKDLKAVFDKAGLKGKAAKEALREFVAANWPDLPPWSTLDGAKVQEVETVTAGSGVVLAFTDFDGVRKVVLAEAGEHYGAGAGSYMIPGGFIDLSKTPGSTLVAASTAPENARTGAAREIEEELKLPDGSPLFKAEPSRLKLMDTLTLSIRGETRIVMGLLLELNALETAVARQHVERLNTDAAYKQATSGQSNNHDSGKPEVSGVAIVPLADVASGKVKLLHKDQQSLFQQVESYYKDIDKAVKAARHYPSIH